MASKMVEIVQSYTDVQLTISPDLTEKEIEDLKKYFVSSQATLLDYRKLEEFDFEFSIRSYFNPNSTKETSDIASKVHEYFTNKKYKVCFKNVS